MPTTKTPKQWMDAIKSGGLFVLRDDEYYFIPVDVFSEWRMPPEFQKAQVGIPDSYFQKVKQAAPGAAAFNVHDRINDAAGGFSMRDGFDVAAWIEPAMTRKQSITEDSQAVLFDFNATADKIVIDMSKGTKPSKNT
jgi:hypothetical protein